jgi:NADPH:quinone reductase-like Zn-dependent oxidoreductase
VEARNLAPLSADIDLVLAAALPISGLTAWQALFTHGHLHAEQTVLIHGAAGGVGSAAVQLAREVRARVIGTGRAAHRQTVLDLGADDFVDLDHDLLENIGEVDLVLDVLGGDILDRSAELVRAGGAVVSVVGSPRTSARNRRDVFFVVEPERAGLAALDLRLADGRLRPLVGTTYALEDAVALFAPVHPSPGKPIVRVVT